MSRARHMPRLRLGLKVNPDDPTDPEAGLPVHIGSKESFQGVVVTGKVAGGKSMWLLNIIYNLILSRIAFIVMDPSGFLARDVFSAARGLIKYCSIKCPRSINPLRLPYGPSTIVDITAEAINQVIQLSGDAIKAMTPKMRVIWSRVVTSCLERNQASLEAVRDEIASMRGENETRDGILARLGFILSNPELNRMLCGPGALDIQKLSSSGQGFILDCNGMSTEGMIFTGNILSQTVKAHLRFADYTKLHPLVLVIDECHNFISPSWMSILKEGRKFLLSAILATQDLAYFDERMRRVMMNVGTIVSFRVGSSEANYIARELHIQPHMLQFAEKHHFFYLTPSSRGYAKAPYPPVLKKYRLPTVAMPTISSASAGPATAKATYSTATSTSITKPISVPPGPRVAQATETSKSINHAPMPNIEWFPLQPFPPPATSTPEAAPVEAHGAETPLSKNLDGSEMHTGTSA